MTAALLLAAFALGCLGLSLYLALAIRRARRAQAALRRMAARRA
jgi:hypothetical protein